MLGRQKPLWYAQQLASLTFSVCLIWAGEGIWQDVVSPLFGLTKLLMGVVCFIISGCGFALIGLKLASFFQWLESEISEHE